MNPETQTQMTKPLAVVAKDSDTSRLNPTSFSKALFTPADLVPTCNHVLTLIKEASGLHRIWTGTTTRHIFANGMLTLKFSVNKGTHRIGKSNIKCVASWQAKRGTDTHKIATLHLGILNNAV